ncbi:MAG: NusG domain II-containing protein [Caulobacteraceae bacterium]
MKLKKGDVIVIALLIIAAISWFAVNQLGKSSDGRQVAIEVNGKPYKVIPLKANMEKQEIHIDLENGKFIDISADENGVYVKDVDCPDRICQKTGVIDKAGQSIICLPNKVGIYIEGKKTSEIDGVSF